MVQRVRTTPVCRHCTQRSAIRPRGLCGPCYADPLVRVRYPAKCQEGMTDREIREMKHSRFSDRDLPPPAPYVPPVVPPAPVGGYIANWWNVKPLEWPPHPDFEPAAIRAKHVAAVARAVKRCPNATPEQLSERLCLPAWNIRRALRVLGGEPDPAVKQPRRYTEELVMECLEKYGPQAVGEIAKRTGKSVSSISRVLHEDHGRRARVVERRGSVLRPANVWGVIQAEKRGAA